MSGPAAGALVVEDLVLDYGPTRAVDGLSLEVAPGQVHGLLGPNGSGKTTTLRVAMGFLRPGRGRVAIGGVDIAAEPVAARAATGYLPGDVHLDPRPSGRTLLDFLARLRPVDPAFRDQLVARLDLDLDRSVKSLSKGNRQKLAIVAALQHRPAVALLDEPTTGLDPLMQREFFAVLGELAAGGSAILFSTHVLAEIEPICDVVSVLRKGRKVVEKPVADLAHDSVRRLEIVLADEAPEDLGLPGAVLRLERHGRRVRALLEAEAPAIVAALARLPIVDVVIERPDVEDLFLKFYDPGEERLP